MHNPTDVSSKFAIGIITFVVLFIGAVWLAQPQEGGARDTDASSSGPSFVTTVGPSDHKFGTISMAAGRVSKTFEITNSTTTPITITRMYTSCMCTRATLAAGGKQFGPMGMPGHGSIPPIGYVLAPGEKASVEVVFDPAAHGPSGVGPISRLVRLETSAGAPLELTFDAFVRP